MAFLPLHAVARVHLHYGIQAFADGVSGVFVMAYLLRAGVSLPTTLSVFAVILGGRFVMRPAVLPFARRWGLRPALILGTLFTAVSFTLLPAVEGVGGALAAYCLVSAFGSVFYWTCFHAYFAVVGSAEDRGHQVGVREALATALGIAAPALGGWTLATAGPGWTFMVAALLHAMAALPLVGAPDVPVASARPGGFRAARRGALLYLADGPLACGYYLWQVVLFMALGESFAAYGGAMAFAAVIGSVAGLVLGRHIDSGHGGKAVLLAYVGAAGMTLLRAASGGSALLAVTASGVAAICSALVAPVMMAAAYNLAKAAPCPLSFNVVTEGAWDLSCGLTYFLTAGLVIAGVPLPLTLLLGLPSAVAVAVLLRRYYRSPARHEYFE